MVTVARETLINTRTHCMDIKHRSKAVQSLDLNGLIIDVSPAWLELTGYLKEEVLGKHFMDFLHADSLKSVKQHFPILKDYGYVDNVYLNVRTKDNQMLAVCLNGTSKYDQNGLFERTYCELTQDSLFDENFADELDQFLSDMESYVERLGKLLHRKQRAAISKLKSMAVVVNKWKTTSNS